ncbi:hypothetical protein AUJ84_01805 [Candidatus Pacearchaeota archaeon CG1_02_32_132]|nr:MAG: hypothetical protein AUJ84_01805 [Candidatus Pacearchaeota archaeon CG1_02_32_132]
MKKKIVLSLGGSIIIPKEVDYKFLNKFKETLRKNYGKYQFVVVCGGGIIARKYITALKKQGKSLKEQSLAGIRATRMNALFMTQFFGKEANETLPKDMKEVRSNLKQNKVVFCGALRYADNETSDGTAAKLAHFLKADFVNLSNVSGLYSANPKTHKNAKFIPKITWDDFEKRALKIKYKPGQHFVLDQKAAVIIKEHKIKTYLIGPDMSNMLKILKSDSFHGTLIYG